jgi:hypothetical protein
VRWIRHACLFVGNEQLVITLTELAEGSCRVETRHISTEIETLLGSLGFAVEIIPQVIARINLGEEIEFVDRRGVRSLLRHDPQTRRISVRAAGTA